MAAPTLYAPRPKWLWFALLQGILSPLLFVVIVVAGGLMHPGYSHLSQAISELTMADAVNKPLLDLGLTATELMTIAFGLGFLWAVRAWGVSFKIAGVLIVIIGLIGLLFSPFPMDPIGGPLTRPGAIHLILIAISSPLSMAIIVFAAFGWRNIPGGRGWSIYSFITFAVVFLTGLLSAIGIAQGWPVIGLLQRLSAGAFLLWKVAMALELMKRTRNK